jgi:hypothetical protein
MWSLCDCWGTSRQPLTISDPMIGSTENPRACLDHPGLWVPHVLMCYVSVKSTLSIYFRHFIGLIHYEVLSSDLDHLRYRNIVKTLLFRTACIFCLVYFTPCQDLFQRVRYDRMSDKAVYFLKAIQTTGLMNE